MSSIYIPWSQLIRLDRHATLGDRQRPRLHQHKPARWPWCTAWWGGKFCGATRTSSQLRALEPCDWAL